MEKKKFWLYNLVMMVVLRSVLSGLLRMGEQNELWTSMAYRAGIAVVLFIVAVVTISLLRTTMSITGFRFDDNLLLEREK